MASDECNVTFKPCFRNCDGDSSATCWSLFLGQLLLSFCLLVLASIKNRGGDRSKCASSICSTIISGYRKVTAIVSCRRIRRRAASEKNQESLLKGKGIFDKGGRDRDVNNGKNQDVGDESFRFPIDIKPEIIFDTEDETVKDDTAYNVQDEKDGIIVSNHRTDSCDSLGNSVGIDDKEELDTRKRRASILRSKNENQNPGKINENGDGGSAGLEIKKSVDKSRRRKSIVRFKDDQSINEMHDPKGSEHSTDKNHIQSKPKEVESKEPFLPDVIENDIDREEVKSIHMYVNRQSLEGQIDISSHLDLSGSISISDDSLRNDQLSLTSELIASVKSCHQKNPVLTTWRSHLNFCKTNDDPSIKYPSPYSPEYVPLEQDSSLSLRVLKSILGQKETLGITISSLGYAFLTSAFSSLLVILSRYEDSIYQNCPDSIDNFSYREWIQGNGATIRITLGM